MVNSIGSYCWSLVIILPHPAFYLCSFLYLSICRIFCRFPKFSSIFISLMLLDSQTIWFQQIGVWLSFWVSLLLEHGYLHGIFFLLTTYAAGLIYWGGGLCLTKIIVHWAFFGWCHAWGCTALFVTQLYLLFCKSPILWKFFLRTRC